LLAVLTLSCRGRNAIERMFGRLNDFRRIATRYDRLARNYLAAVHIAAVVSYWLRVRSLVYGGGGGTKLDASGNGSISLLGLPSVADRP